MGECRDCRFYKVSTGMCDPKGECSVKHRKVYPDEDHVGCYKPNK